MLRQYLVVNICLKLQQKYTHMRIGGQIYFTPTGGIRNTELKKIK